MRIFIHLPRLLLVLFIFALFTLPVRNASALTVGETYTITLSKLNSNGTVSEVNSSTAVADSNGKIEFSFSNVPNTPDTYFLLISLKDSNGTTVRQGIAAAPPAGSTNQLGINELTQAQAKMLLQSAENAGTDDPIMVAFGLLIVRSPYMSNSDINHMSGVAKNAIVGNSGFNGFLLSNGITASQLNTMRQKLVYNSTSGAKDLRDYISNFKTAVDATSSTTASEEMAKAGGFLADIFMDAGNAAGIDPALILAAHDAAGYVAENDADFGQLSTDFLTSIQQVMGSFFKRIATMRIKTEYSDALTALGASGSQVSRFNNALDAMASSMQAIDTDYMAYFENPDSNDITAQSTNTAFLAAAAANPQQYPTTTVQDEINWRFNTVFNTFISAIRITDAEATSMRTQVVTGLVTYTGQSQATIDSMVPANMGKDWFDFNGNTVNWPIPMSVAFNTVGAYLQNGGDFNYTRQNLTVPGNMAQWLDSDDDPNNGVDGQPHDFVAEGLPIPFAALMGMQEDVKILDHIRFYLWDPNNTDTNGQPTRAQEKAAKLAFVQAIANVASAIGGTTNGSTDITTSIKKAFVKMMQEPTIY